MFWKKEKKHQLYYLLPGMTRANREKRRRIFLISLVVGVLVAGLMGATLYYLHAGARP